MRIAIYHNVPDGGVKRSLFHVIQLLSQYNHSVDLYTFDIETEQGTLLAPSVHHVISVPSPVLPMLQHGYPLIVNTRNLLRQHSNLRRINQVSRELASQINTGGYDIAFVTQCHYAHTPNLLRFLTIPTIYYCHEPFRRFYESPIPYRKRGEQGSSSPRPVKRSRRNSLLHKAAGISYWLSQSMLKRNDQANMSCAPTILTNSYFTREFILRVYAQCAHVHYWGVDSELFRKNSDIPQEHLVLAVGRYYPVKQHHFILNSLSYIPEKQRPGMVIIGNDIPDQAYKAYLTQLAEHHHISLRMLDNIRDEELIAWYNRVKVVAFPPILEPFGFVPLEAMACQTPVVGVREGGIRETIRDGVTGILTDRDEQAFGTAIHRLLYDAPLRRTMGENGRKEVLEKWTWERSVQQLLHHFHTAIETHT